MKKLLFITLLAIGSVGVFGQSEALLNMKGTSANTDTLRVLKDGGSALMLKSTLFVDTDADISDIQDSLAAHNAIADNAIDSLAAHNAVSDNILDSLAAHNAVSDNILDSLAAHNAVSDNILDSLGAHVIILNDHESRIDEAEDSVTNYDTRILLLESAPSIDSTWDRIIVDTVMFPSETSYMYESAPNVIYFKVAGFDYFRIASTQIYFGAPVSSAVNIIPTVTSSYDLGSPTRYWDTIHSNVWSVGDANTLIYLGGSDLTFDDANNTATTLAELVAGSSDSITAHDIKINANLQSASDNADSLAAHVIILNDHESRIADATEVSYTACTYNSTTNITIGTTANVAFKFHYVAERNTGSAVWKEFGNIDVGYDDTSGTVYYSSDFIGVDLGFDIEADVSGGNIRLNIIVDNSVSNNLSFDETLISKFYE